MPLDLPSAAGDGMDALRTIWGLLAVAVLALSGSAVSAQVAKFGPLDDGSPRPTALPAVGEVVPTPPARPCWSLPQIVQLAAQHHPDLAAARARAAAARGKLVQAGFYPNPLITPRIDDLGHDQNALGSPGVTLQQEIVTAKKLQLAQAAAAHGVAAADWQAMTRWFDVLTRVRVAYVDVLTAQREIEAHQYILKLASDGYQLAVKLEKAGIGGQPDILRAKVELEQSNIRLGVARQKAEAAWRQLVLTAGVYWLEAGDVAGQLEMPPPAYGWAEVAEAVLARSSEVQEAQALRNQAERLVARARAEPVPNVLLVARPFYAVPANDMRVLVEAGFILPVWNQNQGNVAAARGDLAQMFAQVRQVELRLTERLNAAYLRYQAARQQVEAYRASIIPDAEKSLELVRLGYLRGEAKYDYTAVLQAQVILGQAKLQYATALGELWRGVSEVAGLVQEEEFVLGCGDPARAAK